MFLSNSIPNPVLLNLDFIKIYWYGFLITLALVLGFLIFYKLIRKLDFKKDDIFNLAFWLIIWGVIGGRLYHIFSEITYYFKYPLEIFYIWNGGMGIYGSILAGILVIYFFSKKYKLNFLKILDFLVPGLALAQAIGRWGNYFNQELYGLPTNLPWKVIIDFEKRVVGFKNFDFFHPTFLYESLFCLILFLVLFFLIKKNFFKQKFGFVFLLYIFFYSIERFFVEFLRIDYQPEFLSLRLGHWTSLVLVILSIIFFFILKKWYNKSTKTLKQ